jgi:hypothetical protein
MAKILSIVLLLMIIGAASAANFGSTTKSDTAVADKDAAVFVLLFWSSDEQAQKVRLSAIDMPENWGVTFEKNNFGISNSEGNEMIYASGKYVRATSVDVAVDTNNADPGTYSILISARSYSNDKDISFSQERIFNLTVSIKEQAAEKKQSQYAQSSTEETQQKSSQDVAQRLLELWQQNTGTYIYAIAFIIIIFISYLIYKRS